MLGDMLLPHEDRPRVEVITGIAGRRYWPAEEEGQALMCPECGSRALARSRCI